MARYTTLTYGKDRSNRRIARITLNRPEKYNAINDGMPGEIRRAVGQANEDPDVHVIILQGRGEVFCAGFDIGVYGEGRDEHPCKQEKTPWDPMVDYATMKRITDDFMSLWRSHKPVIARVQKYAIAGGSDIALSCDQVVMEDTARIGYMPTRVWGCPTTAWWFYKVGIERAKRLVLTGDLIDGVTACSWGLVGEAVPAERLDDTVDALAERMAGIPQAMLMMNKLVVNQAVENMGLANLQTLATVFDGITRHDPSGMWFRRHAQLNGFKDAVRWRDSGKAIPQGDEARAIVAEIDRVLAGDGGRPKKGTARGR